jgi:hypothetical protein
MNVHIPPPNQPPRPSRGLKYMARPSVQEVMRVPMASENVPCGICIVCVFVYLFDCLLFVFNYLNVIIIMNY